MMGNLCDTALSKCITKARRSCDRDHADDHSMNAIRPEEFERINLQEKPRREDKLVGRLCVVGLFFLMRSDELLTLPLIIGET